MWKEQVGKVIFGQERKFLRPHLPVILSRQMFPVLLCQLLCWLLPCSMKEPKALA